MRFDIMTLFPDMVNTVLGESILGRAQKNGAISVFCHNIRDYAQNKHNNVDDTPFGGGMGMVMAAPPVFRCHEAIMQSLLRLATLPDDTKVYSGHGPATTIGREKQYNPYMRC